MVYTDYPRGYLWRCKIDGSEKLQLTDAFTQMPTWSPDSRWIAYSDWREIYRVSVESGAPEKLTSEGFTEVLPNWSPDGKSIYFNDYPIPGHLRIRILDLETRKVSTMPGSDGYYAPLWSPDGQYLAAIQNPPKSLAIYSVKTKQWKQLEVFEHDWGFFVWAPDSKSLYLMRGPAEAASRRANGNLPADRARREVGVIHQVYWVELTPAVEWWISYPSRQRAISQPSAIPA